MTDSPRARSLDQAVRWLDDLELAAKVHTTGEWQLVTVLEHLAQSVEMSLDGFPAPKPAWFQRTVGAAAFAFFGWRGRMSHGLAAPIPGAAPLSLEGDWKPAARRLRAALERFEGHAGPLAPHFAYGALGKDAYAVAHGLHIANHRDEIVAE